MTKRPTTTSTRPPTTTTPTKPSRASRAAKATAAAAPAPRVPHRLAAGSTFAPSDGDDMALTPAQAAQVARETRAVADGPTLAPQATLDRDLAHLADPNAGRRTVSSRRRRDPEEVAMVYRGSRHRGALIAQEIDVQVPTEDNVEKVADVAAVVPGMDEPSQRAAWAAAAAARGVDPGAYIPLAERLIIDGIDYHFSLNKTTLCHEDDVDYMLSHPYHRIEMVDGDPEEQEALPPSIVRRNMAAAASYRRGA